MPIVDRSTGGPLPFGLEATDVLLPLVIITALAVPLSPSSWRRASECGRSNIGKLCDVLTLVSAALCLYVWSNYSLQGSYRAIDPSLVTAVDESTKEVTAASLGHFGLATIISATAFSLELFHVIADKLVQASATHVASANKKLCRPFCLWTLAGLSDSEVMLIVYTIVLGVYGIMFMSSGRYNIIHDDPFVTDYHRPVNAVRFFEWAVASPILMALNSRSIPRLHSSNLSDRHGEALSSLFRPGLVITVMYMWVTWLAQVVLDFRWRVILTTIGFFGYSLASIDQCTSWLRDRDVPSPTANASVYLLIFQVVFYGLYGVVFLLGMAGVLDPITEQKTFSVWDVTIKVAVSAATLAMRSASLLAETRKAKRQHATAADDLTRLIDTASAPIFAVDQELKVTLWNKKLVELTGRSADEVMGMFLSDFLSPDCRDDAMDVLGQCSNENPTTGQFHCDFLSEDSASGDSNSNPQKISIIMTGTIRHNANNDFIGIVGVGQDLTEVTRYRDIEVRKRQLMAMVSHEIKSPLHGIIGLSETLSSTESDKKRSQQLKMVKSCATRLLDLVSNIMDMSVLQDDSKVGSNSSKGITGDKPLAEDPVEIGAIIAEVCTLVRNAVNKANKPLLSPDVHLINEVGSSSIPIVIGDAYKITQVFYNILTNACKFCSSGEILASAWINYDKNMLNVCIKDTGVGIGDESIKRIFEPFEQEQATQQRSFGGIGLGLAIAREVMRKHGGDITVKSILGEGSTFTVSFPVTPENMKTISSSSRSELSRKLSLGSMNNAVSNGIDGRVQNGQQLVYSNLHRAIIHSRNGTDSSAKPVILSVDDDLVNQEVIKSALSENYEIHTAMDGFQALQYFERRAKLPDLVLLDVMMPGMTGFEVLESIRKNSGISPAVLPIIMLSATEPVGKAIIQSLNSGSNDYVSKPFDISILRARVHTAVQIKRLHDVELEMTQFSQLLYEIMPRHIVQRLISGETAISERHDSVCILFSDIVGWTTLSEELPTAQLIGLLNSLFSKFDDLTEKYNVYKVDTIGDGYIVACGHDNSDTRNDYTHRVVDFALAMIEAAKSISMPSGLQLQLRVGIHTGPTYTGVIGNKVPKYTFFGDTVNTSSRMESTGISGCIQITTAARQALDIEDFYESDLQTPEEWLKGKGATLVERGNIEVKNKGMMKTHIIFPCGVAPNMNLLVQSSQTCSMSKGSGIVNDVDKSKDLAAREEAEKAIREAEQKAEKAIREAKAAFTERQQAEEKLRGEISSLHSELQELQASEKESREECERLQLVLAESQARLHSSSTVLPTITTRRPSSRRSSSGLNSRTMQSNPLRGSFVGTTAEEDSTECSRISQITSENEQLRLQLCVTTKALQRARANLLTKEEEIDTKEFELQSMIHSSANPDIHNQRMSRVFSAPLLENLSRSQSTLRSSFSERTRELLRPIHPEPSIK